MTELPEPDATALAHSERLRQQLIERMRQQGMLSFAEYMEQVLYEPGLGYYMAGAAKFGDEGDFITAPEVSPLFGAALANELRGVLVHTGGGILEFGAGSGKLALSILQALSDVEELTYTILEPSAELVNRQQRLLGDALDASLFRKVRWVSTLPESFTGAIVANEVMDALPVERFRKQEDGVVQLCVDEHLATAARPAGDALREAVLAIENDLGEPLPDGYQSEVCLLLKPWLASLAQTLAQGVVLLIDYGYPRREYYLPERMQGTLACYYRHRTHDDPFRWPGLQDITAHVDFTAVAEAAVHQELDLLGYASQSAFLLDNRLLELTERESVQSTGEMQRVSLARAVKTLTLPGEMGERFQVMALGRGYDLRLQGFSSQDLSYRL
ncbi:class I SAM-dependent methyltransferase [Granulosicoccus sp. 3-233]|uniref:class I SAM-dependent methyltransferase n=1 Tax=Granulosicoccus sp. 3-233 TaxID=3417969 RepID=UPI003D349E13